MFFDIVDMTMAYIQYLALLTDISPSSLPSFYSEPFKILNYFVLDISSATSDSDSSKTVTNPLPVELPSWLPLDIRLRFASIAILGPLVLATVGLLGVYGKLSYIWFIALLASLFSTLFGFILLVNQNVFAVANTSPPSNATLTTLLAVGLPCFFIVMLFGILAMGRSRLIRLRKDNLKLDQLIKEEQEERTRQRVTRQMVERDDIDLVAVASQRLQELHCEQEIQHANCGDLLLQAFFSFVLFFSGAVMVGLVSVSEIEALQSSIVFKVIGAVLCLAGVVCFVWFILGLTKSGRKLRIAISDFCGSKLLSLIVMVSSMLYTTVVVNFVSIVYCSTLHCSPGTRLPKAAALFPTISSNNSCFACDLAAYPQQCNTQWELTVCAASTSQRSLVYDGRVACSDIDSFYKASGSLIFVCYILFLPYLQFYLAQYTVRVLRETYPLEHRYYEVFTKEEIFYQKAILSVNNASSMYRAYKPEFRFYRLTFLLQKLTLAVVSRVTRTGVNADLAYIGIAFFIVVPLIALICAVYFKPFSLPLEQYYFPSLQAMVVLASVVCLFSNIFGVDTFPLGFWIVISILLIMVPLCTLVVASVLSMRLERHWRDLFQQRLVQCVTAALVVRPREFVGFKRHTSLSHASSSNSSSSDGDKDSTSHRQQEKPQRPIIAEEVSAGPAAGREEGGGGNDAPSPPLDPLCCTARPASNPGKGPQQEMASALATLPNSPLDNPSPNPLAPPTQRSVDGTAEAETETQRNQKSSSSTKRPDSLRHSRTWWTTVKSFGALTVETAAAPFRPVDVLHAPSHLRSLASSSGDSHSREESTAAGSRASPRGVESHSMSSGETPNAPPSPSLRLQMREERHRWAIRSALLRALPFLRSTHQSDDQKDDVVITGASPGTSHMSPVTAAARSPPAPPRGLRGEGLPPLALPTATREVSSISLGGSPSESATVGSDAPLLPRSREGGAEGPQKQRWGKGKAAAASMSVAALQTPLNEGLVPPPTGGRRDSSAVIMVDGERRDGLPASRSRRRQVTLADPQEKGGNGILSSTAPSSTRGRAVVRVSNPAVIQTPSGRGRSPSMVSLHESHSRPVSSNTVVDCRNAEYCDTEFFFEPSFYFNRLLYPTLDKGNRGAFAQGISYIRRQVTHSVAWLQSSVHGGRAFSWLQGDQSNDNASLASLSSSSSTSASSPSPRAARRASGASGTSGASAPASENPCQAPVLCGVERCPAAPRTEQYSLWRALLHRLGFVQQDSHIYKRPTDHGREVLTFDEVYTRRLAAQNLQQALKGSQDRTPTPDAPPIIPGMEELQYQRPFWGHVTDAVLGAALAPGSSPPWATATRAPPLQLYQSVKKRRSAKKDILSVGNDCCDEYDSPDTCAPLSVLGIAIQHAQVSAAATGAGGPRWRASAAPRVESYSPLQVPQLGMDMRALAADRCKKLVELQCSARGYRAPLAVGVAARDGGTGLDGAAMDGLSSPSLGTTGAGLQQWLVEWGPLLTDLLYEAAMNPSAAERARRRRSSATSDASSSSSSANLSDSSTELLGRAAIADEDGGEIPTHRNRSGAASDPWWHRFRFWRRFSSHRDNPENEGAAADHLSCGPGADAQSNGQSNASPLSPIARSDDSPVRDNDDDDNDRHGDRLVRRGSNIISLITSGSSYGGSLCSSRASSFRMDYGSPVSLLLPVDPHTNGFYSPSGKEQMGCRAGDTESVAESIANSRGMLPQRPEYDPIMQQLRCLYLLRERLKESFWDHRKRLKAVQRHIDYEINAMVRRILFLLFVILGVVACLSLTLALCGMLHSYDSSFIDGVRFDSYSKDYQLAGYESWSDFTSHCCCVASANMTADYPYYALDVENWICDNGITKERVRRDLYTGSEVSGYMVRSLCGMTFSSGCSVVVSAGLYAQLDCSDSVPMLVRERW